MITRHEVLIPFDHTHLQGMLAIPPEASGLVIFVHGSGSSRFSVRNQQVARSFNDYGIATLLFDLLTNDESKADVQDGRFRFNINLLANRLNHVTKWVHENPECHSLKISYFGASTGAAAAIVAASEHPEFISSIVSRGGRPDLAGISALHELNSPILLIVGGNDREVIELNEMAIRELRVEHEELIVDGATHLFEEPGALEQVAEGSAAWILEHFAFEKRKSGTAKKAGL